jgi:hypothetical protein
MGETFAKLGSLSWKAIYTLGVMPAPAGIQ